MLEMAEHNERPALVVFFWVPQIVTRKLNIPLHECMGGVDDPCMEPFPKQHIHKTAHVQVRDLGFHVNLGCMWGQLGPP